MKRVLMMAALALAGFAFVGCDKDETGAKDVNQAAKDTGKQAADALDKTKSGVSDGVDAAKKSAEAAADSNKEMMGTVEKQIDDLIGKAKDAVKDKKWSDAEGYIAKIKELKGKLPEAAQVKIDASLSEVQKLIDAGKMMVPSH